MSMQTTMARAESRAASERWHDHWHLCPPCQRWVQRRLGTGCITGRELRQHHREASDGLSRERELDRQPLPGELPLF